MKQPVFLDEKKETRDAVPPGWYHFPMQSDKKKRQGHVKKGWRIAKLFSAEKREKEPPRQS